MPRQGYWLLCQSLPALRDCLNQTHRFQNSPPVVEGDVFAQLDASDGIQDEAIELRIAVLGVVEIAQQWSLRPTAAWPSSYTQST